MQDLPFDDHELDGWPPCPAESQAQWHPPEISHQPAGTYGDVTQSVPSPSAWASGEHGDWLGDAFASGGGTELDGPGSSMPFGSSPGAVRRQARRRGSRRPARWLVACAAVVPALAAGGGIALVKVTAGGTSDVALSGSAANAVPSVGASSGPSLSVSPSAGKSASASASASMNMGMQAGTGESGPGTLAGVLGAANNSVEGNGLLPPAKCGHYQQNAGGAVVCTAPVPGVAEVFYQNYSSLAALYGAYKAEVAELDGGTFRQNTRTCGNSAVSYAEFGWNQEEGHPHDFTVAQMASGKVEQVFASGRMACFATRTPHGVSQDIVWTIDNGPAMGVAIGSGSPRAVYQLWGSLHHAVLFRGTEMCGTAPRMNLHDIPTGNLKVIPVCPLGVEAVPASPPA